VRRALALCALAGFALAAPAAGAAEFEIVPGSFKVRALDAEGNPENRAGSHPDRLQIDFGLNAEGTSAANFAFEMPPGLGGAPGSVPQCPRELFDKGEEQCPEESRVGTISLDHSGGGVTTLPIFEVEPTADEIVVFGSVPASTAKFSMQLRPEDSGVTFEASEAPEADVTGGHVELWGVPADHQSGTTIPRRPFLTLPARCGPLEFGFRTRSHEPGAPWLSAVAEAEAPLEGCAALEFAPHLGFLLSNPAADSPTGARIDLTMSHDNDPDGLASAQIRNATIQLPPGLTVSPAGAAGLTACSDDQLGLDDTEEALCPPSSKVGTVELVSPALPKPLSGNLYLGQERPGERFRLFVVAPGPGVVVKVVSTLQINLASGRLSTVLRDMPQVPVGRLTLDFAGGPQALLASPLTCGSFGSTAHFDSYGGTAVDTAASVTVTAAADGSPCPAGAPFAPRLVVARSGQVAGRPTAFSTTLLRRAGEQLPRRFSIALPKGVSAALGEGETCPDSLARSGACPPASAIGRALAHVGAGSSTVALAGDVYLAGAYRRSPFSLVLAFHASVGPFELGTSAVRSALRIDRRSGRVSVLSDVLPSLVEGIPIRFQSIGISLDRQGTLRNPTSCAAASFDAAIEAESGAVATATSAAKVKGCGRLGFGPRFSMALTGVSELHRRGKPGLRVSTRFRRDDTGMRALHMTLPRALKFGTSGLGELCSRPDALEGLCPRRSRVGTVRARSALLDEPLKGLIHVVQPQGDGLPDLWLSIGAEGLALDLRGRSYQRDGRLRTSLVGLPDMPISSFTMRFRGGRNGVLSLGSEPCTEAGASRLRADLRAEGQNGARRSRELRVDANCRRSAAARDD
jgi:hypothetical protein